MRQVSSYFEVVTSRDAKKTHARRRTQFSSDVTPPRVRTQLPKKSLGNKRKRGGKATLFLSKPEPQETSVDFKVATAKQGNASLKDRVKIILRILTINFFGTKRTKY